MAEVISSGGRGLRALRVQLVETADGVILKRGRTEMKVGGDRSAEIASIILTAADGVATRAEICGRFAGPDRDEVDRFIRELETRRFLVTGDSNAAPVPEDSLDVFYWNFGLGYPTLQGTAVRRVAIIGVNAISRQLATALRASRAAEVEVVNYPLLANLRLFDDGGVLDPAQWPSAAGSPVEYGDWSCDFRADEGTCLVVTSDFGGLNLMRPWNEYCVGLGCSFLPVVLQDLIGYVGPLVIPGETSCFECFRARENAHMPDPETRRASEAVAFAGQAISGFHPSMASILADVAAVELSKFLLGWSSTRLAGAVAEVNLVATEMKVRRVLKIPRCSVCGVLNERPSARLDRDTLFPGNEAPE